MNNCCNVEELELQNVNETCQTVENSIVQSILSTWKVLKQS